MKWGTAAAKINILIESLQVDGTWYPITVATNVAAFNTTKDYGNSHVRSGEATFSGGEWSSWWASSPSRRHSSRWPAR